MMKGASMNKKENVHYVNNADFSNAVVEYVQSANEAKASNQTVPIVPNYIAECFLRISEGLSHKSNFIRYTYREEMVMDAVENCLKAIHNYDLSTATRTGRPNAFAYFTQIAWYAFLRRIAKEKKQQDIKLSYLSKVNVEQLLGELDEVDLQQTQYVVESLRQRIDRVKDTDKAVKEYGKTQKKKRTRLADSDLSEFLE
jgi:hypothetical protein